MLGAIIGDIVGSPYEFDHHNIKTTDFPLFSGRSEFTDDTVMTLAVAKGLMDGWGSEENTRQAVITAMQEVGLRYPGAGYGVRFSGWLYADDPQPYGSFGNGAAMRVSPVAWLFDDLDTVLRYAEIVTEVTHNHPEGIRWAKATAAAIFLGRKGHSKKEIRDYVEQTFDCSLRRTCDEIRPTYHHVESCQETVPEAFAAFFEGKDFEDVLRLSVSLGGDSDTLTAISASMAEAIYPIPAEIEAEARKRLDPYLTELLTKVENFL